MWYQRTITLSEKLRGFHLITDEIIDKLSSGLPPVGSGHASVVATLRSADAKRNRDPTVRAGYGAPFPENRSR